MKLHRIFLIFCLLIFNVINAQYNFELNKKDLKDVIVKSLSIDEIKNDTLFIRMNGITSSYPLSNDLFKNEKVYFQILRDKKIYSKSIKSFIDFHLIDMSSNIAYIKYICRDKAMAVHLIFHKKITGGWTIVDKFVWKEVNFKFDDFLYDSVRRKLLEK